MEKCKVSVIIPVYNTAEFLPETLESVSGQTLKEIEIIFVDDGSKDGSQDLIREYMKKDSRIQLIEQKNSYAGIARNNGLKKATGEYVVFWDSDDRFALDALEKMYEQSVKKGADICICGANRFNNETGKVSSMASYLRTDFIPEGKEVFDKFDVKTRIFNMATNVPWNKMYLRSFVEDNHLEYQGIRQANDTYFTLMALFLAEKITYVNEELISYRINNSSSLSGKASDTVFCAYDSYVYTWENLKEHKDFQYVKLSFQNRVVSGLLHALDIQSSFESFELLYNKIKFEGLEVFQITDIKKEDYHNELWIDSIEKMQELSAGDFLLYRYGVCKELSEQRLSDRKNANKRNERLRQRNERLENRLETVTGTKTYRLAKAFSDKINIFRRL